MREVKMPQVFGEKKLSDCVLPLGYHGDHQPNDDCKCDLPNVTGKKKHGGSFLVAGTLSIKVV